jgi:hypothetical protein
MYCPSCGSALAQQMRFCNHCGAQLVTTNEAAEILSEKRLDEYLDGLFWITVFGLGIIVGGMALMKKVFQLSEGLIIAYMILSTLVFLINFGLSLWKSLLLMRGSKQRLKDALPADSLDTKELDHAHARIALEPAPSVTENTTRSFEPIYNKRKTE